MERFPNGEDPIPKNTGYCNNLYILFYAFLFGLSLSLLSFFSVLFSHFAPSLTLSALLSQIPHSIFLRLSFSHSHRLRLRLKLSLALALSLSVLVNGSLSGWVAGPWVSVAMMD